MASLSTATSQIVQGPIRERIGQTPDKDFTPYQEIDLRLDHDFTTTVPPQTKIVSPAVRVHGYNWIVHCFPAGNTVGTPGPIAIHIRLHEPPPLPSKLRGRFEFSLPAIPDSTRQCSHEPMRVEKVWSVSNFCSQETARAAASHDGRLTVTLRIAISQAHTKSGPFRPQFRSGGQAVLNEILDTGLVVTQSVTFVVGEERATMHLPTKLCEKRLPQLRSFLGQVSANDGDDAEQPSAAAPEDKVIVIKGLIQEMTLEAFRMFLSIALTGITPETTKAVHRYPFHLLDLSDRFGFVELKIFMEGHLCLYHMTDVGSALNLLLIAHARNCSLLKEWCIDYLNCPFVFAETIQSQQWSSIVEAAPELLCDMYYRLGRTQANATPTPPRSISELYKMLETKGLDLDGTRNDLERRVQTPMS